MSRTEVEAARRPAGTSDKRYLLHLHFEDDNVCRPSLRDIEDGTLRTFPRLTEMLSFLEEQCDPAATTQQGESENT